LKLEKVPNVCVTQELRVVYDDIKSGRVITQPDFQRRYWWDSVLQTGLINTIICGRVIPEVFTYVYKEKGYEEVVDGQQRLETIRRFVDDEFMLDKTIEFREISGLTFSTLPEELRNKILVYPMSIRKIYSDEIPDHTKIQMFVDLNPKRQGIGIKHQEIRNCIYRGKFNNFLKKLAEDKAFRITFGIDAEHERMLDVETILAFIASLYGRFRWWGQQKSLTNFMSEMSKSVEEMSDGRRSEVLADLKAKFKHGLQCSMDVFGPKAFCERKTGRNRFFSKKAFLAFMIAFQEYDYATIDVNKKRIASRVETWIVEDMPSWEGWTSRSVGVGRYRDEKLAQILREVTGRAPEPADVPAVELSIEPEPPSEPAP
jgi:hypothetical protein